MRKKNDYIHNQTVMIHESEFEQVTDKLIQETIGQDGLMQQHFNRLIAGFSINENPLGVEEAKNILFSLIRIATGQRRLLAGRIEKSIEDGGLFEQYYGKMRSINELTIHANAKMKKMQIARERYEYQLTIYQKVTGKTYERDVIPDESELASAKHKEIWTELDEEGGLTDVSEAEQEGDILGEN